MVLRMNIKNFCITLITCALLLINNASAIDITIEQGIENPILVAIVPFGWSQATVAPIDLAGIITNDLERSARFKAMDIKDLPQHPNEFQDVSFKDWRLLGMENLVIGRLIETSTGDYEVEFRLIDVYKEKQIAGFKLPSTKGQLRTTAHELSDIIYEKLIGVRGAFATRIAYITVNKQGDKKNYSLQIADADGYDPQVLLESPEPLLSPSWSPDGKHLAYVSFEGKNSAIYIQDIKTGKRDKVAAHNGINSAPAWSPDGFRLAMTLSKDGNTEIYVMHISSGTLKRITQNQAIDTEPNWSSDGKKLAFTSDRGGSPQIYEVAVQGGGTPKRLTFEGAYNARPRYSSDGNFLAMVTGESGAYRIAILDLRNGFFDVLTKARLDESPSFAPNDHMIIYTTSGAHGTALAAVSADGQVHQRLVLQDGEVREPAWGPFLPRR
jgi:TolB protein